MSEHLLVSPVSIKGSGIAQRSTQRLLSHLARQGAAVSRALLGGRGIGLGCTIAAGLAGSRGRLVFELGGGGSFGIRTDDRYWLHYLLLEGSYEPDLDHFLSRALTSADSFLDCGANLGLWSIAAARVVGDPRRVVAVEAGGRTLAQLEQNWIENRRSFTIRHLALGTSSGEEVSFYTSVEDHASATLVEGLSPSDARMEKVTTISLVDLVAEQRLLCTEKDAIIFVKLDVEGMERAVISTLDIRENGDLILLYEDHGSDTDHVSKFVLEQGFDVAFLADDGTVVPISDKTLNQLDLLKVDPARGYNLLAYLPGGPAAARMIKLFGTSLT